MRKTMFTTLLLCISFYPIVTQAQQSIPAPVQLENFTSNTQSVLDSGTSYNPLVNFITPVWTEDFGSGFLSSPNGAWTVAGPNALWQHTTSIQPGCFSGNSNDLVDFATKSNGFALFHSDDANCINGSATSLIFSGDLISPIIDLSDLNSVGISFEHLYRYCCGEQFSITLAVSNDGGLTWHDFQMHSADVAVNSHNQGQGNWRPLINISSIAANESNVRLKFTWNPNLISAASHYFWAIDDIELFEMPENDLVLNKNFYAHAKFSNPYTFIDSDTIRYQYSRIPFHQAAVMDAHGKISNFGLNAQNTRLELEKGNTFVYSNSSMLQNDENGDYQIFNHQYGNQIGTEHNVFIGATTTDLNFVADMDATPWNNKYFSGRFDITENIYSRDKGDLGWSYGAWGINSWGFFDSGDAIGMGILYEMNNDASLEEVILGIHPNTNITTNVNIVLEVYSFDSGLQDLVGEFNYSINPSQISSTSVTLLPLSLPAALTLNNGQTYEVRVRHTGNANNFVFATAGRLQNQEHGSSFFWHDGAHYANPVGSSLPVIRLKLNCINTSASITEIVCDSYIAPDGAVYTNSGIYTAIIPNAAGCDSTITIDLTVNESSEINITEIACDSYTAPDGNVYTTSGIYTAILLNAAGCDSTITIDLTVNESSTSNITEIACDSYTAPDGNVYTTSGIYTAVLLNAAGCDSTITIDLTVNESSTSNITEIACDSYTAPDSNVYTTSGIYTAVLLNAAGCDSTITIDLTVNESSTSSISESICGDEYTAPDGEIYNISGSYTAIIPNASGCDSLIMIDLTLINIDVTIEQDGDVLTSIYEDASYQWFICEESDLVEIQGANEQSYTVPSNGSYTVAITDQFCEATAVCIDVDNLSTELWEKDEVLIYPNPTQDYVHVLLSEPITEGRIAVLDASGRMLLDQQINDNLVTLDLRGLSIGVLIVRIQTTSREQIFRIMKTD